MIQDVHGVGVPGVLRHVGKGRPALALPAPVAHGLDHQGAQLGPGQLSIGIKGAVLIAVEHPQNGQALLSSA